MRILHLCTDAYGGYGGIALYNRDVVEALAADERVEEVIVVPRVIPQQVESVPPKVTFVAEAAEGNAAYLRALGGVLRRGPFDLVICAHVNLLPFARLAAKDPLLLIYGIEAWQPFRLHRLVHRCRAVVSISAVTRDRFLDWSHYRGTTQLLPNAIHAEEYGIRPRSLALIDRYSLEGKRVLLTLGRLVSAERYKGFDEVIEILPELPSDVVYVIAGGGNDAPRLARKAADLGVGNRVVLTGRFPEAEKADLYSLADVYVMASRGEGFGFVFLEALASGVPVIASKCDGGREAVRDGALGLLVDPTNPAEIKAAIVELLERRAPRSVPEGLSYFSFENFAARARALILSRA